MAKNNWLESAWDLFSLALSIQEFGIALTDDDASTLDAIAAGSALAFDVGALIVPGLPGGAGATLHTVREGERLALKVTGKNGEDLTDTVKMAVQEQKATGGTARPRVSVETKGTPAHSSGQISAGSEPRFVTDSAGNTIDLNYTSTLTQKSPADVNFKAGRGAPDYDKYGTPNSYVNFGNGHAVVYGPNGRALYDVDVKRIKVIQWNQNPKTGKWFPMANSETKAFDRSVPEKLLKDLGIK